MAGAIEDVLDVASEESLAGGIGGGGSVAYLEIVDPVV
jgi:hypothetical protein